MPEIVISSAQLEALEALQDRLADEHVGAYGTVRPRDAIQYLLDRHEADGSIAAPDAGAADADGASETSATDAAPEDRLETMMNLLSTHDDKWEVSDSEEGGKYVVELPDGKSMHVRTKDDVRGMLFKHYG